MRRTVVLIAAIFIGQVAFSDDAKAPKFDAEQFQKQFAAMQESALPYKSKQLETLLRTPLKTLADPGSSADIAKYMRNLYDSLIKEGFTKDEAFQLILRMPFPPIPTGPIY
jgi:hypothetical protein